MGLIHIGTRLPEKDLPFFENECLESVHWSSGVDDKIGGHQVETVALRADTALLGEGLMG